MIDKALSAGLAGEKLSRIITGTHEVSAGRSAITTGSGAGLGYPPGTGTSTGVGIGLEAVGITATATATVAATVFFR